MTRLLQTRGYTVKELRDEFGVTARTVYRDLLDLGDQFKCELKPVNGRYKLESDIAAPDIVWDIDELRALYLACRTLEKRGTFPIQVRNALEKLRAATRGVPKKSLQELDIGVKVLPGRSDQAPEFLAQTLEAYRLRETVDILYHSPDREEPERRQVEPWGVFLREDLWYLVAYCRLRKAQRTFRIARILEFTMTGQKYDLPKGFDPSSAAFEDFDVGDGQPVSVRLRVEPDVARRLSETPGHPSQKIDDGVVSLSVRAPLRMIRWLLGLRNVEVLEPPELRAELARQAGEIAARHSL